ncbi:hypothetical protein [Mycolicibacterium conceptionense]|uniref:hypothetical protein n=1 Tax=Mycolicibacterium conceptionense TaxID=451644 RepID=UPI00103A36C1|nr:hypothetical protein [Mycolicibacterium conceptionense]
MKPYTLGDLIDHLQVLGNAKVRGLSDQLHSDRGDYERSAIAPGGTERASQLARMYMSRIGSTMTGWKGGDFPVRTDLLVMLGDFGNCGPCIVDLIMGDDGVYEVVTAEDPLFR